MTKRTYLTLRELIYDRKLEAAVLATAVERHGIYVWDRFGRFVKVHGEYEREYSHALDLIAQAYESDPEKAQEEIDFEDEYGDNVLETYGWPYDDCPDFEKIAVADPLVTRGNPQAFISINDILDKRKAPPGEVAAWIEANGVWAFNEYQTLDLYPPQSPQAQLALSGIAFWIRSEQGSVHPDFEAWYLEDDPTYRHGWPGHSVPRFGKTYFPQSEKARARLVVRKSFFTPELRTLGRLLVLQEARPGEIATSIEQGGIYGFDDYGRVVHFARDTAQSQEALSALKRYSDLSNRAAVTPDLLQLDEEAYTRFGWPPQGSRPAAPPRAAHGADPALAAVESASGVGSGKQSADDSSDPNIGNRKSSYDALILGLLCFIRGEITGEPHVHWKEPRGQNDLIRNIREKIPRLRGLRETNIRKMFADANKLRPEANLPRLNIAQEEAGNDSLNGGNSS
jgi:hypothetical protein